MDFGQDGSSRLRADRRSLTERLIVLIDIRELPDEQTIEHQVCIVGCGAAGITLARTLATAGLDVALLESGGREYDNDTQLLYDGEFEGYEPLTADRLRYFGGSTNHWAGMCRPFSSADFSARGWFQTPAQWPINLVDIKPFMAEAWQICSFGRGDPYWSATYWQHKLGRPHQSIEDGAFEMTIAQQVRAQKHERNVKNKGISFATIYGNELAEAESVRVYLHANVTEVHTNADGNRVEYLEVRTLEGKQFSARAKQYVLACGGIENARLLLASNSKITAGVGNSSGVVGAYFMDHTIVEAGRLILTDTPYARRGFEKNLYGPLRLRAEVKREHRLTNAIIGIHQRLDPAYDRTQRSRGVAALRNLLANRDDVTTGDLARTIAEVVLDFDDVAAYVYARRAPHLVPIQDYQIHTKFEPEPRLDNRVTLSEKRDVFGRPLTKLRFTPSENDVRTVKKTMELFGQWVGRLGFGRLQLLVEGDQDFSSTTYRFAHHHMGTTRMSSASRTGVVDANCRAHDVDNLHIAGSSVFTTAGSGTPTLMIVTLALRLAEHLKLQFSKS